MEMAGHVKTRWPVIPGVVNKQEKSFKKKKTDSTVEKNLRCADISKGTTP